MGFHLGMMAYLDHLGLMQEVTIFSTVSGGTFLGAGYALALKDEKTFQEFYEDTYGFLASNLILGAVLEELGGKDLPPSGRRNLVTAIANVYDKHYFRGRTFGRLWEGPDTHLSDVIFNATEFKTGIAFRFQRSEHKSRIGNGKVFLDERFAKQIRMADIMAASSCIPGGLEPLTFPQDFHWPGDDGGRAVCADVARSLNERFGVGSFALMDGGVYDNQGISSVLLAINRHKKYEDDEQLLSGEGDLPDMTLTGRFVPTADGGITPDLLESSEQLEDRLLKRESGVGRLRGHHLLELINGQPRVTAVDLGFHEDESGESRPPPPGMPAHDRLGLFVISDTPVRKDPVYRADPRDEEPGRLTVGHLQIIGGILLLASLMSVVAVSVDFWSELRAPNRPAWTFQHTIREIFTLMIPFFLTAAVAGAGLWLRSKLREFIDAIPEAESTVPPSLRERLARRNPTGAANQPSAKNPWRAIRRLTLHQVGEMLGMRIGSMYAMANEVFMNRIRDLGYALVHSQPDLEHKIIANEIFTLLDMKDARDLPVWLTPTPQMRDVVIAQAASMGTKLWWAPMDPERRNELDVLVAAGQITTCYNLLSHMWLRYEREPSEIQSPVRDHGRRGRFRDPRIEDVFARAEQDWEALREDAYAFVDKRRAATQERRSVHAANLPVAEISITGARVFEGRAESK